MQAAAYSMSCTAVQHPLPHRVCTCSVTLDAPSQSAVSPRRCPYAATATRAAVSLASEGWGGGLASSGRRCAQGCAVAVASSVMTASSRKAGFLTREAAVSPSAAAAARPAVGVTST